MTTTPLITPQAAPPLIAVPPSRRWSPRSIAILLLAWFTLQIGGLFTPGLLDDVDSIYIEIAREMLHRHDYVTPYINGIRFFDKPPLMYWMAAGSMHLFGMHDWAARLPLALAVLALLIAVYALGIRLFAGVSPAAHPDRGGFYAALAMATSIGPYLYTRFFIPDILLALWMTLAVHLFLIALDRIHTNLESAQNPASHQPQIRVPHLRRSFIAAKVGIRAKHEPLSSTTHETTDEEYNLDQPPSTNHKSSGAPSFAPFAKGGKVNSPPHSSVISTGGDAFAAVAEKPASLPRLLSDGFVSTSPLLPCLAFAAVMALNVLTKGLIGLVFPIAFVFLYLALTKQLRLLLKFHPIASTAAFLAIAAPWHILAALRTPPIALPAGLGLPATGGWAWFYLYNEHFARFLGKRIPHDYGLTPVWLFWLYLAIWIMPWATFLPAAITEQIRTLRKTMGAPQNRIPHQSSLLTAEQNRAPHQGSVLSAEQNRVPHLRRSFIAAKVGIRAKHEPFYSPSHETPNEDYDPTTHNSNHEAALSLLLWAIVVVGFFSISSRQEYYSLPALPALALMAGGLLTRADNRTRTLSSDEEDLTLSTNQATNLITNQAANKEDRHFNPSANSPAPQDRHFDRSSGFIAAQRRNPLLYRRTPSPHTAAARSALHWHLYFLVPLTTLVTLVCGYFALTAPHPAPGTDISTLLADNPEFYNLSLGHLFDLTGAAMGLFRGPLLAVALSMAGIGLGSYLLRRRGRTYAANLALAASMTVTLMAAHTGLARFYPILGSKSLALAINQARQTHPAADDLILLDGELTSGSTLIFYTGQQVHLLNGRVNGLWYGSFWPDAPAIFETESTLHQLWSSPRRIFLMTYTPATRTQDLTPYGPVHPLAAAGGKTILTNH